MVEAGLCITAREGGPGEHGTGVARGGPPPSGRARAHTAGAEAGAGGRKAVCRQGKPCPTRGESGRGMAGRAPGISRPLRMPKVGPWLLTNNELNFTEINWKIVSTYEPKSS